MAGSKQPPLRVLLVDDHEVVRSGVKALLQATEDIVVTGEAGTVREAVDEADRTRPDVVVMDVRMRRANRDRTVRLTVADLPTSVAERVSVLGDLEVITLTPAIRQERGVRVDQGVLIYNIGAAAQRATGLQPGDVIFQINRQRVAGADDF